MSPAGGRTETAAFSAHTKYAGEYQPEVKTLRSRFPRLETELRSTL